MGNKKESEKKKNPKSYPPNKTTTKQQQERKTPADRPLASHLYTRRRPVCALRAIINWTFYSILSYHIIYIIISLKYNSICQSLYKQRLYWHAIVNFSKPFSTPPHSPPLSFPFTPSPDSHRPIERTIANPKLFRDCLIVPFRWKNCTE